MLLGKEKISGDAEGGVICLLFQAHDLYAQTIVSCAGKSLRDVAAVLRHSEFDR